MAVPKKHRSRTRNRRRRATKACSKPNYISCPQCGEATYPHRVCMSCGYYKGRAVIEIKAE